MKRSLLQWLVCSGCQGVLRLEVIREDAGEIEDGSLICVECGHRYAIRRGVARMIRQVRDRAIQASFGFEWTHVEPTDDDENVVTFFRRTGIDPHVYEVLASRHGKERTYPTRLECGYDPDGGWLRDKVVLEAGCGMGRYLQVAKPYAQTVIGVDFSDSVDRAQDVARAAENVHVVQADLLELPFRPSTFDFIYCIGVLPFTQNPRRTVQLLSRHCREDRAMTMDTYGRDFWLDPIRGSVMKLLRVVTTRLPHPVLLWFCRHVAYPIGRLQMRVAPHPVLRWLCAPLFLMTVPRHRKPGVMIGDTFDMYSPKRIWVHREADVRAWFAECGFTTIRSLPVPTGITIFGSKGNGQSLQAIGVSVGQEA